MKSYLITTHSIEDAEQQMTCTRILKQSSYISISSHGTTEGPPKRPSNVLRKRFNLPEMGNWFPLPLAASCKENTEYLYAIHLRRVTRESSSLTHSRDHAISRNKYCILIPLRYARYRVGVSIMPSQSTTKILNIVQSLQSSSPSQNHTAKGHLISTCQSAETAT